jgi:hypothetical protein
VVDVVIGAIVDVVLLVLVDGPPVVVLVVVEQQGRRVVVVVVVDVVVVVEHELVENDHVCVLALQTAVHVPLQVAGPNGGSVVVVAAIIRTGSVCFGSGSRCTSTHRRHSQSV